MKVIAIVLGSIAGLVLLAVIALAIALPLLGKKFIADSSNPASLRATTSKIAEFTIPAGFELRSAIDLGVAQTAIVMPKDRSKYSVILQLTSQHVPPADTKATLDQMATSAEFGEKLRGCDLKPGPDDTIAAGGKTIVLRSLTCARSGTPLTVELALLHARASNVQLVANDVRSSDDRAALASFVRSVR